MKKNTIKKRVKKSDGKTYTVYECKLCGNVWDHEDDAEQCYSDCSEWAKTQLKREFGIN